MSNQLYARQRDQLMQSDLLQAPGLGWWNMYFWAKLVLVATGAIGFLWLPNLVLLAWLLIPFRSWWSRLLQFLVALPAAIVIAYQDSYLPPFSRLLAQWQQVSDFSWHYRFELLARFVALEWVAGALVLWIIYLYAARVVRPTAISLVVVASVPLWHSDAIQVSDRALQIVDQAGTSLSGPGMALERFYQQQEDFQLNPPSLIEPDTDVLLLNICSLAWDDLQRSQLTNHPALQGAHITLNNFYSGSSYSGPASLRLLRGGCGHEPHQELFTETPSCALPAALARQGYNRELVFNHTADYDNYRQQMQQFGGFPEIQPMSTENTSVIMNSFDLSPIYSDSELLRRWLANPTDDGPSLTFYNSVSLHDGNQLPGFRGNSLQSYRQRTETLLDELQSFFESIQRSDRKVLVVIVPEHGAGLAGDRFQVPGMREIPSPTLTHVPVMMRLFGHDGVERWDNQAVEHATGPAAVTAAIYQILAQLDQNGAGYNPERVAQSLPRTLPVAENDNVVVIEDEDGFYLRQGTGGWMRYPGFP